jgi:hypothetical protein
VFEFLDLPKPLLAVCRLIRYAPIVGGSFNDNPLVFASQIHFKELIVAAVNDAVYFNPNFK